MNEVKTEKRDIGQVTIDLQEQLLYGDTDRYGIYQLKDNPELCDFRFAGTAELWKRGILSDHFKEIQPGNYNLVYAGELSDIHGQSRREKLGAVFEKFNIDRPEDFKGHSLSVSDIVVLHEKGKNRAHFVDSYGFTELPDLMRGLEKVNVQETETAFQPADGCANAQGRAVSDFKEKTNELFREISGMNPSEIEETVKCHVRAKLNEYGIDAEVMDAAVVGSRCRGIERDGADLDVVVELSTNEREDDLFGVFNEDGLHIGEVAVDINPITAQRTGTLETYLPQVEIYLENLRKQREQENTTERKDRLAGRESLKERLAQKKVLMTERTHEKLENSKKKHREM